MMNARRLGLGALVIDLWEVTHLEKQVYSVSPTEILISQILSM